MRSLPLHQPVSYCIPDSDQLPWVDPFVYDVIWWDQRGRRGLERLAKGVKLRPEVFVQVNPTLTRGPPADHS